jgi:hypothetical protein
MSFNMLLSLMFLSICSCIKRLELTHSWLPGKSTSQAGLGVQFHPRQAWNLSFLQE